MKSTKLDKQLLFIMIALTIFGMIMILSASSMASYMRYNKSINYYLIRQGIFVLCGLIAFLITLYFPTKVFKKTSFTVTILITISLFLLLIIGDKFNPTAKSWYYIGPISLQPSEFIKPFLILFLANYYEKNKDHLDDQITILKPMMLCIIVFLLVAMQPDLGTASIIALISLIIYYVIPVRKGQRKIVTRILLIGGTAFAFFAVLTNFSFLKDYQKERLNFLRPCERYSEDSGYQLCNSLIAFKNGGLKGKGIGESTQKYLYLPEAHTDFIYPIIVEEWGLIVGIIIILIYLYRLYRMIKITKNAHTLSNSIIGIGVTSYFFLHIVINLLGVMGLAPLTGVPLPFLSYGGSYTLTIFFAMGLIQRVNYETYKHNNKTTHSKKKRIST